MKNKTVTSRFELSCVKRRRRRNVMCAAFRVTVLIRVCCRPNETRPVILVVSVVGRKGSYLRTVVSFSCRFVLCDRLAETIT